MIPEELLERLRVRLAAEMGLCVDGRGWADFERRIVAAARDAGARDGAAYVRRLVAAPLAATEIRRLARFLTVGETYFFRDRAAFAALEARVLPELIRARERDSRRLRIWSAGCCTGEEPYSVAILLDRVLPDQSGWTIDIVGTDMNPQFLEAARRARYGGWSFRGTPAWVRDGYFARLRGGAVDLKPRIRDRVRFEYGNLADARHPDGPFDLILCRNVLMYFTPDQARAVAARFHDALRDDGLLLVSPAETSRAIFPSFAPVNVGDAVYYARSAPAARIAPAPVAQPAPLTPPRPVATVVPLPRRTRERAAASVPAAVDHAARARACADAGRLDDAADACAQAIAADKLAPGLPYLLATIEIERGRSAAAAAALRRALFLDPGFVLAHVVLANVHLGERRFAEAARQSRAARTALRGAHADAAVAEADGLTAARIAELLDALDARIEAEAVT